MKLVTVILVIILVIVLAGACTRDDVPDQRVEPTPCEEIYGVALAPILCPGWHPT